jgi:hypothetical protein
MDELVWQKVLTLTDAQKQKGNPTGNLRLTQAKFKVDGIRIDQTKYFRYHIWKDEDWLSDPKSEREFCEIKFDVYINKELRGTTLIEISHNPSWESSQSNFTTGLRWGPWLGHIMMNEIDCTGMTFSILKKDVYVIHIN